MRFTTFLDKASEKCPMSALLNSKDITKAFSEKMFALLTAELLTCYILLKVLQQYQHDFLIFSFYRKFIALKSHIFFFHLEVISFDNAKTQ